MRGTRRPGDAGGDIRAWMRTRSSCHLTISSRRLPSSPMRYLGVYGEMAARHWARWLPSTFAAIPADEREAYFLRLDDEVVQAIANREVSSMPPRSLQESDHQAYVGQMNMAHLMAEEAVLAEMVLLEPEPGLESEQDEPERDETGAYIDRGWTSPNQEMHMSPGDREYQQGRRVYSDADLERDLEWERQEKQNAPRQT